jgi:hypothetical protein
MTAKPAKSAAALAHPETLQGYAVDATHPAALRAAIDLALDYRGDVTIIRKSGGLPLEGYIFDRRTAAGTGELVIRIMPRDSDDRIAVPLSDVASVRFTGKDTASGKTFENWIRKYAEKKLAGQAASIESEPLEPEEEA